MLQVPWFLRKRSPIIGNKLFAEKKLIYAASPLVLTQEVADYDDWGPVQIDQRQARLADLAPRFGRCNLWNLTPASYNELLSACITVAPD
jgi:hypothetical protein